MMVNPDVDSYAKTLNEKSPENNPKKAKKQQPTENQMNTKTEISLKVTVRFLHLDCQGQNRRQNVINRGASRLFGGDFTFVQGGRDIQT